MFDFVPNLDSSDEVCSLSTFFNLSIYFGILKIKQIKNNEIIIIKIFKFDY